MVRPALTLLLAAAFLLGSKLALDVVPQPQPPDDPKFQPPQPDGLELLAYTINDSHAEGRGVPTDTGTVYPEGVQLVYPRGGGLGFDPVALEAPALNLQGGGTLRDGVLLLDGPALLVLPVNGVLPLGTRLVSSWQASDGRLAPGTILRAQGPAVITVPDLRVDAGERLTLPPGTGLLSYAGTGTVPAGTRVGVIASAQAINADTLDLPEAVIDITEYPTTAVRKGETFDVAGTVVLTDGIPLPDASVHVFLNETKETPGRLAGVTQTDAAGAWRAAIAVPPGTPVRPLHVVAHATPDHRTRGGWSDPVIDVGAAAELELQAPDSEGVGVTFEVVARLRDVSDGAPVPDVPITILWTPCSDPSRCTVRGTTDPDGTFRALLGPFAEPTVLTVAARTTGSDAVPPAQAEAQVRILDGGIHGPPSVEVQRGRILEIAPVQLIGRNPAGVSVTLTLPNTVVQAITDSRGTTRFRVPTPSDLPAGVVTATLTAPGWVSHHVLVRVLGALTPLPHADEGPYPLRGVAPIPVRVLDDLGNPVRGALLRSGSVEARTDAEGWATLRIPVAATNVTAAIDATDIPDHLDGRATLRLHGAPVQVEFIRILVGGAEPPILRATIDGQPLTPLRGTIQIGNVTLPVRDLGAGLARIQLDHLPPPGSHDAPLRLDAYEATTVAPVEVLGTPIVQLEDLGPIQANREGTLAIHAASPWGPLPYAALQIQLDDRIIPATTDGQGRALAPIPKLSPGAHQLTVEVGPTPRTTAGLWATSLNAQAPPTMPPALLWGGLAGLVALAWLIPTLVRARAKPLQARFHTLVHGVEFPGILPEGTPATLVITLTRPATGTATIEIHDRRARAPVRADTIRVPLHPLPPGSHAATATIGRRRFSATITVATPLEAACELLERERTRLNATGALPTGATLDQVAAAIGAPADARTNLQRARFGAGTVTPADVVALFRGGPPA